MYLPVFIWVFSWLKYRAIMKNTMYIEKCLEFVIILTFAENGTLSYITKTIRLSLVTLSGIAFYGHLVVWLRNSLWTTRQGPCSSLWATRLGLCNSLIKSLPQFQSCGGPAEAVVALQQCTASDSRHRRSIPCNRHDVVAPTLCQTQYMHYIGTRKTKHKAQYPG